MKLTSSRIIRHFILNVLGVYIYNYLAHIKCELNFDIETKVMLVSNKKLLV